MEYFSNIV